MIRPRLKVVLVGINAPGYRSLALAYVHAYAAADLRLSGVGITTLDLDTAVDAWWIAYRVLALDPDVVAFSVMCWNARAVAEAARLIHAAKPDALIVLGGPEVGPIAEEVLAEQPAVDLVVRGEGEETFGDVLDAVLGGRDPSRISGVTARRGDRVVSAPDRPLVEDLDSLPSPYLSGILAPAEGSTYLETYRGCPYSCAYCFEGKGYGRIRRFSKERVRAEIEHVLAAGVRTFSFIDPVFNLSRERLDWLAGMLSPHVARGVRLHTVEVDIERIDDEVAALLSACGVASVETGPQTVGLRALASCNRAFDETAFCTGVKALRAEGISVESDLIIGLPGDTPDDVIRGMRFAVGADPGAIQMSTLHVLPGTDLWQHAGEMALLFDRVAPHEVIATADMAFADLRRLEVLGTALQRAYRARLTER
jgi:radical SAM superfamily enzyme YgiQ (UPF0313 family)